MKYPSESELLPWVTVPILRDIEKDEGWMADEFEHCRNEPWYWLVNYVYSIRKDEFSIDGRPEVLRFPPKEHLRITFDRCFRCSKLVMDKSRQMTLSWILMAYLLHVAQFGRFEELIVQTKKEIDADALVKRAMFMLKSQRLWLRPKFAGAYCRLSFPENECYLRGLPGGTGAGDQIRSANPSRYFLDEGGFVDEFEECRTAALACCQDIKIVSTANAGEFETFVSDKLEAA